MFNIGQIYRQNGGTGTGRGEDGGWQDKDFLRRQQPEQRDATGAMLAGQRLGRSLEVVYIISKLH
ncbi:MAG: hypothetical protein LBB09_00080 [Rickettsiales bacterium]|nr:hypothetical protein [Rickettsiales bacterium]